MILTNAQLSELLAAGAAEHPKGSNKQKALQRAARSALFFWPEEAAAVHGFGRSLTELRSVGPWVARVILELLDTEPDPPEPSPLRQGFLTYAEVRETLDANPDWVPDLQGDLQMHSTYSDGDAPVEVMAEACRRRGYRFMTITDHSKGLPIANGMSDETLAEQATMVAALNRDLEARGAGFRVLHGIEMNLDLEGQGDVEPEILAGLDLVLGAFHSKLRIGEDQTARALAAVRNPTVHVLAHPQGRRFNARLGVRADWPKVIAAAASAGTALEIDAHPDRQDLDVGLLEVAGDAGVTISIGTDAHSVDELAFMDFGLAAAIRARIPKERILNFWRAGEVMDWAEEVRRSK